MATPEEIGGLDPSKPRASFCRKSALKLLKDAAITGPPVPVEAVARSIGISVIAKRLPPGMDGRFTETGGAPCIEVAEGQARARQRFTVAHELGHYVLQHYRQETRVSEREADIFAGTLLVPSEWLRRDVKALLSPSIDQLVARYEVSTPVLFIAAKDARLLDSLHK